MIGKLFVPLAVGGGLIFLLSSAASASSGSSAGAAPKNPFDQLPDNLRQLAGQAQATNNPDMLEQMATQLEIRGFGEPARLLRVQATALRNRSQGLVASAASTSSPGIAPSAPSGSPGAQPGVLSPDLQ